MTHEKSLLCRDKGTTGLLTRTGVSSHRRWQRVGRKTDTDEASDSPETQMGFCVSCGNKVDNYKQIAESHEPVYRSGFILSSKGKQMDSSGPVSWFHGGQKGHHRPYLTPASSACVPSPSIPGAPPFLE